MHFGDLRAFKYILFVPVILGLILLQARLRSSRMKGVFSDKMWSFLTASLSPSRRRLKIWLQLLCLILIIVALARPRTVGSSVPVKSMGVEVMLAVDVSKSMLTEDVKPSRLEFTKSELGRLLGEIGGDRVGLIAFAGSAYLLSPLTPDASAINMYIQSLSTDSVRTQGTDFLRALHLAKSAFDDGGVHPGKSGHVTRLVLIVSDGEDFGGGALAFAQKLVHDGIHIFTVAVGTRQGGSIPIRDAQGELQGYLKDQSGQIVVSHVHDGFLQKLAKAGQGAFFHATFGDNTPELVSQDLGQLKKSELKSTMAVQYNERFQFPLALAILIGLLELFLGERSGVREIWRGRFEVGK